MENAQYQQMQLFFTQEEVDAKINEAVAHHAEDKQRYGKFVVSNISNHIAGVMKDEVRSGTMDKDSAQELYNNFRDHAGLDDNTIAGTYAVTVYVDGAEVGTFEEIEADDEDSACSEVIDNLEVEAIVNITVSYNGSSHYEEHDVSIYDMEITAEAVEE